jgi:hypothetical protein
MGKMHNLLSVDIPRLDSQSDLMRRYTKAIVYSRD